MKKCARGVFLAIVILIMLSGAASAASKPRDVTVTDRGVKNSYITLADTVGEFLEEARIKLEKNDSVTPPVDEKIIDNYLTDITIVRSVDINVITDGKTEKINIPALTSAGSFILGLKSDTGKNYEYSGKLTDTLADGCTLTLTTYTEEKIVKTEESVFGTTLKTDANLEKGKIAVDNEGKPGVVEFVTLVKTWSDGRKNESVIQESVIQEPVDRVIRQGTKETPKEVKKAGSDDGMDYVKRYSMNASAYTAGYESTGKKPGDPGYGVTASGMLVQKGVVAVDPSVIPLGTKLYVEGYGYAVAADTGSGIKGEKIDLYYENLSDALKFGRRQLEVYVLTEQ
jgi:3D (Asp-Asp-Asp) domain-containing protein